MTWLEKKSIIYFHDLEIQWKNIKRFHFLSELAFEGNVEVLHSANWEEVHQDVESRVHSNVTDCMQHLKEN